MSKSDLVDGKMYLVFALQNWHVMSFNGSAFVSIYNTYYRIPKNDVEQIIPLPDAINALKYKAENERLRAAIKKTCTMLVEDIDVLGISPRAADLLLVINKALEGGDE